MTHLDDAALARVQSGDGSPERERALEHLASCDTCLARLGDLVRAEDAAPRFDSAPFVARGLQIRPEAPATRGLGSTWLAVAAALTIVAGSVTLMMRRADPELSGPSVMRGAETPVAASPRGDVAGPVTFKWQGSGGAFLIDVFDAERRQIGSFRADGHEAPAPAELGRSLKPGATYYWTVSAIDASGEAVSTAPLQEFRVVR